MKTARQIEAELLKEYIKPELEERIRNNDLDAFQERFILETLAEIDSLTFYFLQFEEKSD